MAVKIAIESFLAVVKRSNLVPPEQLQPLVSAFQKQSGSQNDARKFAEFLVSRKALTAWQAEKLLQGKHKGFFLGKYRLLSLVGKGGMSSVYLAEHVVMRRRCAIKVLPTRRLQNASYLARFHREAQAVASLDHPNIVRAYDVDLATDNGMEIHFLVMEFVDGSGLLDLVLSSPQTRLPPVVAAEYTRQAALGLQHAHAAGLVHRDVKPGNLLVDRKGTVKILDLGLARVFEGSEDTSLTVQHDERVLGTADYLAPEQAVDSHNVDSRADIYSLGCTLYLCLTGQPPFTQGTLAQRLLAHQTREPPAVESVQPEVPAELAAIVRKMMAKDPDERYQTAHEVAAALEAWLKTVPKTDLDRSYAGLDRKTPVPAERSGAAPDTSDADTVQGGSPAGGVRTPRVGTRRTSASGKRSAKRPDAAAASPEERQPAAVDEFRPLLPDVNSSEQETMIGSPPQPPDEGEELPPLGENWFGGIDSGAPTAPSDSPLAIELPVDDDEPIGRKPVRKEPEVVTKLRELLRDPGQRKRIVWGSAAAGCVLLLLLAIGMMRGEKKTPSAPPPPPPGENAGAGSAPVPAIPDDLGPELIVGPDSHFVTINDALDYIRQHPQRFSGNPSWTVKVAGGRTYEESIVIRNSAADASRLPKGVHIVSDGDSPAVLKPAGHDPVVDLDGVEQLTLRGFVLDCAGREIVVRLAGYLVGTRLDGVEFRGLEGVGIQGAGDDVSGLASAPVQFANLRFLGTSEAAVAVRMRDTRQLQVDNCLFTGPMETAVEFTSDVWNADIAVRRCRFQNVKNGMRFSGSQPDLQRIAIVNNTFHKVQNGLVWDHMPQVGSSALTIHHNLFITTTTAPVTIREGFDEARAAELLPAAGALNNWTDRPAESATGENGVLDVFAEGRTAVENPAFASTDPASSDFLKPTAAAYTNALKSPAQGADPNVGAIAP